MGLGLGGLGFGTGLDNSIIKDGHNSLKNEKNIKIADSGKSTNFLLYISRYMFLFDKLQEKEALYDHLKALDSEIKLFTNCERRKIVVKRNRVHRKIKSTF